MTAACTELSQLIDGKYTLIDGVVKSENINTSFVSRILRLLLINNHRCNNPGREVPGATNDEGSDGAVPGGLGSAG